MSTVVEDTITEEKLTDVLLDLKKTLRLTFQQLADICQVSLASAIGIIRDIYNSYNEEINVFTFQRRKLL